ncbi:MAG: hypothetical protein KDA79_05690 [Planctomycetaceae bacterium]|nr:hypothetical protein [Planctomycetaceae bacterium]
MQQQPAAGGRPRDFGELAKRLRGRTLDLLAIGLVGAIIVGIGRQAVQWWAVDPMTASSQGSAGSTVPLLPLFGSDGQPVTIEFGRRQARLTRRTFQGSRESALEQLAVLCLERTLAAPVPRHPPDQAERALLAALAHRQPWDSKPGQWQVFLTEGPVSLAVGLRRAKETAEAPPPPASASSGWRVAANAFAFPADRQQQWTIYETAPLAAAVERPLSSALPGRPSEKPATGAESSASLRNRLLPDSVIPLMSLTAGDGSSVTSFHVELPGSGRMDQFQLQLEQAATRAGGTQLDGWRTQDRTERAVWRISTAAETYRWEVQLRPDPSGTSVSGWASLLKAGSGAEPLLPEDSAR